MFDAQRALVRELRELRDELAVLDLALTDADLEPLLGRIPQPHVGDVLHHLLIVGPFVRAADVVAGVQRERQTFDVVAEHDRRIGILRHAAGLREQAHDHALPGGQGHHRPQPLDLGVEGRAQLGRADRNGHHFGRLGQLATGGELLVVERLGGLDVHAVGNRRQPMGLAADPHGAVRIGQDLRGLEVPSRLVDHDLHRRIFEIQQPLQGGVQRQVGETIARRGDEHTPLLYRLINI